MRKQFFFAITVLILMMTAVKPGPTSGKKISFEVVTTTQELSKDKHATKELFANLSPEKYKKQSKKERTYLNLSLDLDNADSEFNLPIDDSDKFCQWLLEEFNYNNQTIMLAPATGFYGTVGLGKQEVRLAYVLNTDAINNAMDCLEKALEVYPGRM
jgi:aspartate/methionine/tyrosine aminotransferase